MQISNHASNWQSLNILLSDRLYRFVNSRRIPRIVAKSFHAAIQAELLLILKQCFVGQGRVYPAWTLKLKNGHRDWFPVPDLTYISYERLSAEWKLDDCCPVAPELIIEIVQQGQKLDHVVKKVENYLQSGVLEVCLINSYAQSPQTFFGEMIIKSQFLDDLNLAANNIFEQAGCA